jgi:hypothetical protein
MTANLAAADPVLRETALQGFAAKGEGPEKQIVALLDDPDRRVKSSAIYAMARFRFKSAVPKLQNIFRTGDLVDRKFAALALLQMDEPLWAPAAAPQVRGPIFTAAAKLAGGEKQSWTTLLKEATKLVDDLSELKDFPCDRNKLIISNDLTGHPVTTRAPADRHAVSSIVDLVIVADGHLAVNGEMRGALVIVTGDLYLHDGYIYDSLVLVQGKIACDGYIKNSVVVAGDDATLTVDNGYVWGSVAAGGTINCAGYYKNSLLGGKLTPNASGQIDMRESTRFNQTSTYRYLRGTNAEQEKNDEDQRG